MTKRIIIAIIILAVLTSAFFLAVYLDGKTAPTLKVIYKKQRVQAIQLSTNWDYNGASYSSDSPGALQLRQSDYDNATIYVDSGDEIVLKFSGNHPLQSITAKRRLAEYAKGEQDVRDVIDEFEFVEVNGNIILISDDGQDYIYEIYATWSQGNSGYAFRVIIN